MISFGYISDIMQFLHNFYKKHHSIKFCNIEWYAKSRKLFQM